MMCRLKAFSGLQILLFFLIALIFWKWWLPGIRVATDYPFMSKDWLLSLFDFPRLWNYRGAEGLGEFSSFILWSYPFTFLSGLLAKIGLGFSVQERILYIIPIIVFSIFGIRKLLKSYQISDTGIFVSTLFYLTTTYLLLLIDGGQLSIALGYSLFPLIYLAIKKSLNSGINTKVLTVLLLILLSATDVRLLFVLLILLAIRFIYELVTEKEKITKVKSWFSSGVIIGVGLIFLSLYWIIPFLKYPLSSQAIATLTQNIGIQPVTWKHALLLLQPQWYKNVFGVIPRLNRTFILIPTLAFSSVLLTYLKNKKMFKEVVFWVAVALLGIFLAKGSNPPAGGIYNYLFNNIPGFSLFRDSSKFFLLIALSYSVLIAFSVDNLMKWIDLKFKIGNLKLRVIPLFIIFYLLYLIYPVYTGQMTGTFSPPVYQKEYGVAAEKIGNDPGFSRIFYIPSLTPLGYSSPAHPSVEALRLVSKRPFEIGTVGNYEVFNFLREAPYMGQIFKIAGIKYIYYPYPDKRREVLKQDNIEYYYAFLDQLTNLPWIEKRISDPPVAVLQTKETKDHFFIAPNTFYVVGSDAIYNDLMKIPGFDFSQNALIFSEERPNLLSELSKAPINQIILYDKSETDLAASFITPDRMIFPASNLPRDPTNENPLWKRDTSDFLWLRDFLHSKYKIDNQDFDYGGGWAVAEGNLRFTIQDSRFRSGNMLLARLMKSSRGGKVEFWQGENKIGEVNTLIENPHKVDMKLTGYGDIPDQISTYDRADFNWHEVGKLTNDNYRLTIKTFGDINIVNSTAALSDTDWNHAQRITSSYTVLNWERLSDADKKRLFQNNSNATLTYERISPTKYYVRVVGLKSPATLAFSESYNSLWQANITSSYQIYSLINGFRINGDGEYEIYFSPQKYVYPALAASLAGLFVIIGLLAYPKFRKKV